ncbi:MAG: Rpn family recombination-promoting nuclease/putative transposase [Chloroherpetonaceae bacterium]|nr:Rpn family recombination-promoting nuclease/putative transposase [Chloroherpetonaceae bacterium]MDW8437079.1 Rpn family recombination-promoting nuclease/putative transposase [Chloroherpetonaceae bacterium]
MRADKLVYLLLQLAPQGFFALIGRNPNDAERYEFKSVELKETAFRIDGIFAPKSDEDELYFVEAQFQRDETFYARFFAEIFLYLKQYPAKRWKAIALYPSRSVEQKDLAGYEGLLSFAGIQRIYLDEMPESESVSVGLFRLLAESERTAGEAARKLVAKASPAEINLIEQILSYKFKTLTRKEIREMLQIQEELLKDTAFYREAYEEGRAEGEARGELKGKLATVPLLRQLGLSDERIARELGLSLADVQSVPKSND